MASAVDICNMALSYIGEGKINSLLDTTVTAETCNRFYPIARDSMLELSNWSFTMKRISLASIELSDVYSAYLYGYAYPSDCMSALKVMQANEEDDYLTPYYNPINTVFATTTVSASRDFIVENIDGGKVILTDIEDAVLIYKAFITDTSLFPPLLTDALSHLVASYLAGVLIRGEASALMQQKHLGLYNVKVGGAKLSDARMRQVSINVTPPSILSRQ